MQDKERNMEIDNRFRDRSWNEMRKVLDREMPQKVVANNGKKRYLLLAAILMIGFISGTATMFYYFQHLNTGLELTNNLTLTTPETEKPEVDKSTTSHDASALQPEIPRTATENKIDQKTPSTSTSKTNFQQTKTPEKSETTFTHQNQNILNENAFEANPGDEIPKNEEPVLKTDLPTTLSAIQTLEDITTLPIFAIAQPSSEKFPSPKIPKENKWSYSIFAGAYTNPSDAYAGLAFGTKVNYSLNRRLTLSHGLQYSILDGYKISRSNRTEGNYSSDPSNPITGTQIANSFEVYYEAEPSRDRLPVSKLHYIEMPVEIAYRLSGKFQVGLGVKAGYLFGVKVDDRFESLFGSTADQFGVNANAQSSKSNELYNSLKNMDFATTASLTYFPFKKLGVSLQYSHGWVDFTKDEVWTRSYNHFNRNLLLSTVYLF